MSKEVVSYMLSGMDNMKSLQVQLILQCAPFLKGIKVSCILNISKENEEELLEVLKGTGIRFKVLTRNSGEISGVLISEKIIFRISETGRCI